MIDHELLARERALDRLETYRRALIQAARRIRDSILDSEGTVDSVRVVRTMTDQNSLSPYLRSAFEQCDRRWLGAVFRASEGLERIGWRPIGSHKRPVAIWKRRSP